MSGAMFKKAKFMNGTNKKRSHKSDMSRKFKGVLAGTFASGNHTGHAIK